MRLVFLGPPGAGKGTQAKKVAGRYDIAHVSTGDLLRGEVSRGTELGKKARSYMNAGNLVPDDLVVEMIKIRVAEDDCSHGFLLDGFPRTEVQARVLDQAMADTPLDRAVFIDVEDAVVVRRLTGRRICTGCGVPYHVDVQPEKVPGVCDKCGGKVEQRSDDKEELVRKRLEVYREQTSPVVTYYEDRNILVRIGGDRSVDEVFESVCQALDRIRGQ